MIKNTFHHCSGIGPKTETRLFSLGFNNWDDCLNNPRDLPFKNIKRDTFIHELEEANEKLDNQDIDFFVNKFSTKEHWRVLGTFFDRASFFDIETTGLYWYESVPSVISAFHQGEFHSFERGNRIDRFLDLIEEMELLVSFNGNSFDIPFLEHSFNIPHLNCTHIDLRWVAYHSGYKSGLKSIENEMGIFRPAEIGDIDGSEAVSLYYKWQEGDLRSKGLLISYCQADVISTKLVAEKILLEKGFLIKESDPATMFNRAMIL